MREFTGGDTAAPLSPLGYDHLQLRTTLKYYLNREAAIIAASEIRPRQHTQRQCTFLAPRRSPLEITPCSYQKITQGHTLAVPLWPTMRGFMKVLLALIALISNSAWAWQSPDEALSKFLAFELGGGRLQQWEFGKYLAVGKEYDEPGWDSLVLVKSHSATAMSCKEDLCSASVTFRLTPTTRSTKEQIEPHPDGGTEVFTFYAIKRSSQWLLGPFGKPPHISEATLAKLR